MNKIIALWTHPRSVSTAFERVMIERRDMEILHEPFSYLYYVKGESASIKQQFVDPNHPTDYPGICRHIIQSAENRPVFYKDMCSHCYENLVADKSYLERVTHTFLIRDPAKAIASYYAMNKDVTLEEIGLAQLFKVYEAVKEMGLPTVVVDADDLEDNPEGIMRAYCQGLGIEFIPQSLYWEAGHQDKWEIWKDWHKDAAVSTGIVKNMETFEVTIDNSAHLKSYYDNQLPYYQAMYAARVQPVCVEGSACACK